MRILITAFSGTMADKLLMHLCDRLPHEDFAFLRLPTAREESVHGLCRAIVREKGRLRYIVSRRVPERGTDGSRRISRLPNGCSAPPRVVCPPISRKTQEPCTPIISMRRDSGSCATIRHTAVRCCCAMSRWRRMARIPPDSRKSWHRCSHGLRKMPRTEKKSTVKMMRFSLFDCPDTKGCRSGCVYYAEMPQLHVSPLAH